jgi:hypothetical protein
MQHHYIERESRRLKAEHFYGDQAIQLFITGCGNNPPGFFAGDQRPGVPRAQLHELRRYFVRPDEQLPGHSPGA